MRYLATLVDKAPRNPHWIKIRVLQASHDNFPLNADASGRVSFGKISQQLWLHRKSLLQEHLCANDLWATFGWPESPRIILDRFFTSMPCRNRGSDAVWLSLREKRKDKLNNFRIGLYNFNSYPAESFFLSKLNTLFSGELQNI